VNRRHVPKLRYCDDFIEARGAGALDAAEVAESTLTRLADAYDQAARLVPQVRPETVAACKARTASLLGQQR
jgi:hypothetical protein